MTAKNGLLLFFTLVCMMLGCAAPVAVITNDIIQQYELTDDDFRKITFYTDGQAIFVREVNSFDSSRRAAANAVIRKSPPLGMLYERVALESNIAGFYHHRTDSHIFVQFMAGELVLPFNLNDGMLDVSELVYDGKKYKYEEGEARLVFSLTIVQREK